MSSQNSNVRKSVSQTYFVATATILVAGILVMGMLQMVLSIRYFGTERRAALTNVVNIVQAQATVFSTDDATRDALVANQNLQEQLALINTTTDTLLIFADSEGTVWRAIGGEKLLGTAAVPRHCREKMDSGADLYAHSTLEGVFAERCYVVGRAVTIGGESGYLMACSGGAALNEYVQDIFSTFILSAGLMLLVSSMLSILLTARITLPLHEIGEAARKYGGGDFSVRVPVEGDDEVAGLAQTFNTMAANLESIDKSRSQFMGNIAHELRTPMTSIKGFIDGMLDGTIPPEMQQHYLELVSQEIGRLARLVQNMLDITKLEAGEYHANAQSYDVWETVTGVVLGDEQRITEGKVEIAGLAPVRTMVYADPDLVHQVTFNLMDNALKFTPKGGTITLGVRRLPGAMVEVSITNTGAGISPEALPFVFERFYKEDKSRGLNARGSGLGLHICKVLITLSGGTIHVDSKQGEWCRFWFTLPEQNPSPPEKKQRLGMGGKQPPKPEAETDTE